MRSGANPPLWRGGLQHLLAAKPRSSPAKHHPALPSGEIAEFMASICAEEGTAARCLEFTILTAARSEQTNYSNEVSEMALAHAVGDKVEAAYRRGDLLEKRVRLMREWAA